MKSIEFPNVQMLLAIVVQMWNSGPSQGRQCRANYLAL